MLNELAVPVMGSPMFRVSTPALVIAQCTAGVIGSMPALNARPGEQLDDWLVEIRDALDSFRRARPGAKVAPFAINLIVHGTNERLDADLATCARHKVPIVITSLGAQVEVNRAVHGWGGCVLHDVINDRHGHKAIDKGADGLIAVAAGAGGHAGIKSPFALIQELRSWFDGPIGLSGAISTGSGVLAAQAMGADFAYIGSAFIATEEAVASDAYKQAIVRGSSDDVTYSDFFTGVHGNYLTPSIVAAGLDPSRLPAHDPTSIGFGGDAASKRAWKDIWGAGQGIGGVQAIVPVKEFVSQLSSGYRDARARLATLTG